MTPAARLAAAMELLDEIQATSKPADQVSSFYFKNRRYIGSKDRRAVSEIVWRVLRSKSRIDWWLEYVDFPADARSRVLADMAFQGIQLTPELFQGPHSARPLSGEERRLMDALRGKSLFHHAMPAWVKGEFPQWLEPRLVELWGEEGMLREVAAMRDEAPLDVRVNSLKATRDEAWIALKKERIQSEPTKLSPLGLRLAQRVPLVQVQAWRDGLIEVQDEGSQLAAMLADARPGMAVCDYCAGAGGKTLAMAATMQNKGRLAACDVAEWRVDKSQARLRRAGVHNVTRRVISGEADKWIKRSAGSFDRVLVDAPCTGTGTWRRNPDAKWQLTEETVQELVIRQRAIMDSAARLVKPGGRMIYATCSILPEENERQIDTFLAAHPEFTLLPVPTIWPDLTDAPCPVGGPHLRLSPLSHGTDGFFAAVLEKTA